VIGLGVGSGCLGVGAGVGVDQLDWETFFIFTSTTATVTVVHAIFRCFRYRIGLPTTECNARTELQYGIRHLLILTVVVAVMLAVGRSLKFSLSDFSQLPFLVIIVSAHALVGVLSPWAMLRGTLLLLRGAILLVIAGAAGWGVARMIPHADASEFWIGMTLTEAVLLIATLLVVRSCGYRLMRRRRVQFRHTTSETANPSQPHHQSQESQ